MRIDEVLRALLIFGFGFFVIYSVNQPRSASSGFALTPTSYPVQLSTIAVTSLPFGLPSPTASPTAFIAAAVVSSAASSTPAPSATWLCPRFNPACSPGQYKLQVLEPIGTFTATASPTASSTPSSTPSPTERSFTWINGCCLARWNGSFWEIVPTPQK
jgi:hypothetical protein